MEAVRVSAQIKTRAAALRAVPATARAAGFNGAVPVKGRKSYFTQRYVSMTKDKPVLVTWIDSCGSGHLWESRRHSAPLLPAECESVGFIVDRADDYITLSSAGNDSEVLSRFTIPKACIKRIRRLHTAGR